MRPIRALIIPFVLAASASASSTPPAAEDPAQAQTAQEQRVSVTFSATDAQGHPIRGLSIEQVLVYENSRAVQTLEVRDASELPLHLGIVLLASKTKFGQEQAAAIELAQKALRPGKDEAFVITAGGDKPWPNSRLNWLTDPSAVAEAVRGLDRNIGLPDMFNYALTTDAAGVERMSLQRYNTTGGFSIFDVVWAMMKNDPRPARRAVVIFRLASAHSPGFGQQSVLASDDNHNRVITIAQSLGVSFFTIGVEDPLPMAESARADIANTYDPVRGGQGSSAREYDQRLARERELQYTAGRHNVDRIADETGGRPWWTTKKNYSDAVVGIANELAARYIVSFPLATGPASVPVHPLKVQVTGAAHVLAPRAYIVPTEQKANQ
jgi:VWFA-related protein